jgi:hypothetical protein
MEFDKSKVYTSVNADELKVGSKVICANDLFTLNYNVEQEPGYTTALTNILPKDCMLRFETEDAKWALAYLVSEPEEKKLKWSDLKIGDTVRRKNRKLEFLVTGIDYDYKSVFFGDDWFDDEGLENWEKEEKENEKGNRGEN